MALPVRLARYQSLLDLLVEAALREMDGEAAGAPSGEGCAPVVDPQPNFQRAPESEDS